MRGMALVILAILGGLSAWVIAAQRPEQPSMAMACCCCVGQPADPACSRCETTPDAGAAELEQDAEPRPAPLCPCRLSAPRDFAPALLPLGLGTIATLTDRIGERVPATPPVEDLRLAGASRAIPLESRLSMLCRWRI
ncbi:MAG: hypothetical protein AB7K52_01730 [Phycisphaerales bacterium]